MNLNSQEKVCTGVAVVQNVWNPKGSAKVFKHVVTTSISSRAEHRITMRIIIDDELS